MEKKIITIKFKKITNTAIMPSKERDSDAGIDLYAAKTLKISANMREAVPTGYAVAIPKGYYGQIQERSGYSLKNTLVLKAGVIDSEYRGEIKVVFQNTGEYPVTIEAGEKIAQLIILPIPTIQIELAEELDETERGNKGFGSSDKIN